MTAGIGEPLERVDGRQKVTGQARFAAEHNPARLVHAVLVTSTIASGMIDSIDPSAALKATGVLSVISHLNAPKLEPGGAEHLRMPFADASVKYLGQAVAVVLADTLEHAAHGAELVRISYGESEARISLDKYRGEAHDMGQPGRPAGFAKGDADGALSSAAVKVDQVYATPCEHHNPMEPHALVASWDGDHLTVQDASQNVFGAQSTLSTVFGVPKANVHVISKFVGGAFGCKGSSWPHVFVAVMAARVLRRPVKLVLTRRQMFTAIGHRPETEQHVVLGASADGKLVSLVHEGIGQGNSVCDYGEAFTMPSRSMYSAPNIRVSHKVVALNQPSGTYMRAPGENPGMFALESAMDELAGVLKMDPLQLRRLNHADRDPVGDKPWTSKSLEECYSRAAERFGWSKRSAEPRSMREGRLLVGWGMASATYPSHRMPATARARIKSDGTVLVTSGTQEMGMGTATVMTQLAAETLGVPVALVRFELGDTDLPEAPMSAGSMGTASVGSAVFGAAEGLRKKIVDLAVGDSASPLQGAAGDQIVASDGRLSLKGDPARGETYVSILARHYLADMDNEFHSEVAQDQSHSARAFGAHFVEVAVDADLAIPRVRRVVSAFASGRILNAKTAHSQYLGGIVQGIGMALLEGTHLDQRIGAYTNVNLAENMVPVNADIPSIDIIFVPEEDSLVNPIGVKGIGEIGIVGVAAAVANAVYHATGKRVRDLPITIDKLI